MPGVLGSARIDPDRGASATALGAAGLGCLTLYLVDPASVGPATLCPFRALTGYQCPLCGGLRSTRSLLHGDVGAAFELNPLFVLSLPLLLYFAASLGRVAAGGVPLPMPRITRSLAIGAGIVIGSFWLLRNLI